MKIRYIKERSLQAVGPLGPFTRVFAVGEILDLPDMHAQLAIAQGDAVLVGDEKPAKKAEFKADAVDGDGDGKVQDATEYERPAKRKK